ncbi:MAG: 50S ribosomal protein L21 [Synergistales bacterium]|nr:50S ribosomal protein L21 [Synergistales bacterium]
MFAVVETGGKQYRVAPGDVIKVERLPEEEGQSITLSKVHLLSNDGGVQVGNPLVEGASVSATVLQQGRNKKVNVFKYKSKKKYRRMRGHRQPFTELRIDEINA